MLLAAGAEPVRAADLARELTFGGSVAFTTNYIYRGLSESGDDPAAQADVHVQSSAGTYVGAWGSTRDNNFEPYADFDVELYLGQRFDLSNVWGVTMEARSHYYVGVAQHYAGAAHQPSDDYQQISASLVYLDRWTLSVTAIPNAVRYWYDQRLSRSPAWAAETSVQWLLWRGLFLTGSAGYYYSTGTGPGIEAGLGYAYGSVGLAFEYRRLRVDVGYFATENQARQMFPYPRANRVAATLAWRF